MRQELPVPTSRDPVVRKVDTDLEQILIALVERRVSFLSQFMCYHYRGCVISPFAPKRSSREDLLSQVG